MFKGHCSILKYDKLMLCWIKKHWASVWKTRFSIVLINTLINLFIYSFIHSFISSLLRVFTCLCMYVVCMCRCICVCVCLSMHVHMHVYGDQRTALGIIPPVWFTIVFEKESHCLKTSPLGWIGWSSGICLSSQCWYYRHTPPYFSSLHGFWLFNLGSYVCPTSTLSSDSLHSWGSTGSFFF